MHKYNDHDITDKNKDSPDDKNDHDLLKTTETDMFVDILANSDKTFSDKYTYRDRKEKEKEKDFHDDVDKYDNDNIDEYLKDYKKNDEKLYDYSEKPPVNSPKNPYNNSNNYNLNGSSSFNTNNNINTNNDKNINVNTVNSAYNSGLYDPDDERSMSPDQLRLKKLDMIRKLGELKDLGVILSQNYSMASSYNLMKNEYELHTSIRKKKTSLTWASNMLVNCFYGLEILNDKTNWFDLKLSGWSEQMSNDMPNYYDVLSELYEKYNKPGKSVAPEIKLLLMVSGSALKFHLANSLASSLPKVGDVFDKDPQLLNQLRQQAVASKIKQQNEQQTQQFNDKVTKEHVSVAQNLSDLNMLRQKEMEYLNMQQNNIKQNQYEELKMKLSNQNKNQQPNIMKQPNIIPQTTNFHNPIMKQPQISPMMQKILETRENIPPPSQISGTQLEQLRQQQIYEQQKKNDR